MPERNEIPSLPDLDILGKAGEGGMSVVWKARDLKRDRIVAVKMLNTDLLRNQSDISAFVDEEKAMEKIRHPGIVAGYELACHGGRWYFVMEFVDGYNFQSLLARKQHLRESDCLLICESLATALDYAWNEHGLVHCDIKPENIMINQQGEIKLTDLAHQNWNILPAELTEKLMNIDFSFLGLNLGEQPKWNFFFNSDTMSDSAKWLPALGLFLIPFISAALSWVSMKVSNAANPQNDAQTQSSMQTMNIMMPLMSVWFCFIMPAAMGVYWIANSLFGMTRDYFLTRIYKKQLDIEDAERLAAKTERERELELKRLETERLKAEGKTEKNVNTSKKKIQANEKAKSDERKAELDRADRAARRERLGIKENELPPSQVGNRRYARGRAYVPDRFTNPENAEAATIAAAELSEGEDPIDESVEVVTEETVVETAEAVESEEIAPADDIKQE